VPRLGLALSGGGLRATLFHLGVVRFLRDAGLLRDVTHIVSVSGGSILGAHLALNWERYNASVAEFEAATSKILDFVRFDARNHIARRIPFLVPFFFLQRLLLRRASSTFTETRLLERLYARHLYGDARVHQLPESPELHLLTTNVSEGGLCSFTRAGLIMQHRSHRGTEVDILPARLTRIALAVTASSAFPGFFSPVLITAAELGVSEGDFPPQTFTDGGVYDNLGVRAFDLLGNVDPPLDLVLVSDVGKTFRVVRPKLLGMIGRSLRATDILWDRVGRLEKQRFESDHRFLFVPALNLVDLKEDPTAIHPVIQPEVANIRTDIDRFSPLEITALVRHGYCVARKQCRSRPEVFGTDLPTSPPWDPVAGTGETAPAQAVGTNVGPGLKSDGASTTPGLATEEAQQLHRSAGRRVWSTLLDFRDWPTYVYVLLLVLLLGVLPVFVWRDRQQASVNAMIVDAIAHGSPDFRKILELMQRDTAPAWTPQTFEDRREPTVVDYKGFEFVRDTHIVDLRDLRPKTNDVAHYYRSVRVRKVAKDDRLVLQLIRPFDRVDFHCGPEKLKPLIRRVLPRHGERDTTWELTFDLSAVPRGGTEDIEVEATVHDIMAKKGEGENWMRYRSATATVESSVWLIFPVNRPYTHYSLIRYSTADPSSFQKVDTLYRIRHPRGSIIAWSLINPEVGYVYECDWEWGLPDLAGKGE
jgi:predicted acylesterase/phospholipase RssA